MTDDFAVGLCDEVEEWFDSPLDLVARSQNAEVIVCQQVGRESLASPVSQRPDSQSHIEPLSGLLRDVALLDNADWELLERLYLEPHFEHVRDGFQEGVGIYVVEKELGDWDFSIIVGRDLRGYPAAAEVGILSHGKHLDVVVRLAATYVDSNDQPFFVVEVH